MEEIQRKIIEYLSKENIPAVYFKFFNSQNKSAKHSTELAIWVKKKDIAKWKYFDFVLNNSHVGEKIVDISYHKGFLKGILRFRFRDIITYNEKDLLIKDLYAFLDALEKKYYKVCPTKQGMHILIKPTHRCNLDCKYCFDKPHRERIKHDMPMEVLDRILQVASQTTPNLYLSFHGGEPTMVGTEWYERAFKEVISKYPMLNFKFDFVSNGTRLGEEWFDLFKKYNITFCVSYNANYQSNLRCISQLNDENQKDLQYGEKVEKVIKEHDIGVVDVVTKQNYKNMIETYEFYKKIPGRHSIAMNVVNENSQTEKNDLNMTPEEYSIEFLKFFKYWLYDKDGIHERACASMLDLVMGNIKGQNVTCEYRDCRGERFTINPLGEIYECDKFLPERYKAGTIFDIEHLDEIYETKGFKLYSSEIDERFEKTCSKCDYFFVCHGSCHASVIQDAGDGKGLDKFACESIKLKFNGVYDILREVDSVSYSNINNYAASFMYEYGFFSVKEIKQILQEIGSSVQLEYDQDNLFECSEYKMFSAINHENFNWYKYGYNFSPDVLQILKEIKRTSNIPSQELYKNFKHLTEILDMSKL